MSRVATAVNLPELAFVLIRNWEATAKWEYVYVLYQSRIMIAKKNKQKLIWFCHRLSCSCCLPHSFHTFHLHWIFTWKKNFLRVKKWIAFNFAPSLFLTRISFNLHVQNRWSRGKNRGNDSYEMDICLVVQAFWWSNALNRDVYTWFIAVNSMENWKKRQQKQLQIWINKRTKQLSDMQIN